MNKLSSRRQERQGHSKKQNPQQWKLERGKAIRIEAEAGLSVKEEG